MKILIVEMMKISSHKLSTEIVLWKRSSEYGVHANKIRIWDKCKVEENTTITLIVIH